MPSRRTWIWLETAKAAEFFGSDGLIVSGVATGAPVEITELESVSNVAKGPILIGSGATPSDVNQLFEYASGVIVGSYFKVDGRWENSIDPTRVREFVKKAKGLTALAAAPLGSFPVFCRIG